MIKKALIVDHDDSFIWNIKFWLQPEFETTIINHKYVLDFEKLNTYDLIILSPGPKHPADYPKSLAILNSKIKIPILGICLGHQMMTLTSNGVVSTYTPPLHGKKSKLCAAIEKFNHLQVARYHSLRCIPSDDFNILATSQDDHSVMWVEHKNKKQMGLQFHPESFLTEKSDLYRSYILSWMQR
jgi:anthranilate synthase/aminodeoxychorismate synthase-like glutamine amidotransferase